MKKKLLKVILKTKNEDFLLDTWIQYYINLIGKENIVVLDDNSTSQNVLQLYKKYELEVVNPPARLKGVEDCTEIHKFPELYESIFANYQYCAMLDTDEYLCYFDFKLGKINNNLLIPFLETNNDRTFFTTTWVHNLYHGQDYASVLDVTDFNFSLTELDVRCGKPIITTNGTAGTRLRYNKEVGNDSKECNLIVSPELLLLHINNCNWESRIKSDINYIKQGLVNFPKECVDFEEVYKAIKQQKPEDNVSRLFGGHHEVHFIKYYTDKPAFLKSKAYNPEWKKTILKTNVIRTTIEKQICSTSINNGTCPSRASIINLFKKAFNNTRAVKGINRIKIKDFVEIKDFSSLNADYEELVLGTAFGYQVEHIYRFVESLRRHYKGAIVFIIKGSPTLGLEEYFKDRNIQHFRCSTEMPVTLIQVKRFGMYKKIIELMYPNVKRIFLSDVRDVFFQASPFFYPIKKELCFYKEPVLIKNSAPNKMWMQKLTNIYEDVQNEQVICSGTTLGTKEGILNYCSIMDEEITATQAHFCEDQGIHMKLIYEDKFSDYEWFNNGEHNVMTCSYQQQITFNTDLQVLNTDGNVTPVIHQYDRTHRLQEIITRSTTTAPIL